MRANGSNRLAEGLGVMALALILVGGTASVAQAAMCCHLACSSYCPQWAVQSGKCPPPITDKNGQLTPCVQQACATECANCVQCPWGPPPTPTKKCDESPCAYAFWLRPDGQTSSSCYQPCNCSTGMCTEKQFSKIYVGPSNANVYCGCP